MLSPTTQQLANTLRGLRMGVLNVEEDADIDAARKEVDDALAAYDAHQSSAATTKAEDAATVDRLLGLADEFLEDWRETDADQHEHDRDPQLPIRETEWAYWRTRILACVEACAGVPTVQLRSMSAAGEDDNRHDWTSADSKAATVEGWDLFDSSERGMEIERIDCPENGHGGLVDPPFNTDDEAIGHVYGRAQEGSSLHQKALFLTLIRMKGFSLPSTVPVEVIEADLTHLVDLCERAGLNVAQDAQPNATLWGWSDDKGNNGSGFDSERTAILDALDTRYGDAWRFEVGNGDTRRGFIEFCQQTIEDAENDRGMKP